MALIRGLNKYENTMLGNIFIQFKENIKVYLHQAVTRYRHSTTSGLHEMTVRTPLSDHLCRHVYDFARTTGSNDSYVNQPIDYRNSKVN